MGKKETTEFSTLNPQFRTKIKELLETIMSSISALYQEATHDEKTGLYNNKFFNNIFELNNYTIDKDVKVIWNYTLREAFLEDKRLYKFISKIAKKLNYDK